MRKKMTKHERIARNAGWIVAEEVGWNSTLIIHKSNADDRAGNEYGLPGNAGWKQVCREEGLCSTS